MSSDILDYEPLKYLGTFIAYVIMTSLLLCDKGQKNLVVGEGEAMGHQCRLSLRLSALPD